MEDITKDEKKSLKKSMREFKKQGLQSYAKYLREQLAYAEKAEYRASYIRHLEQQVAETESKIARIDKKLAQG